MKKMNSFCRNRINLKVTSLESSFFADYEYIIFLEIQSARKWIYACL